MAAGSPPRTPQLFDRYFRWRGEHVSRLEAITDTAFGLVLSLLFLQTVAPATFGQLQEAMLALVPFAITFTLLVLVWSEHYFFFRRYDLHDGVTIPLNFLLLFLVAAYAYPLRFLFSWLTSGVLQRRVGDVGFHAARDTATNPVWFYSAGIGAIYLTYAALYAWALRRRSDLSLDEVETFLTKSSVLQCLVYVAFAVVSLFLAAFVNDAASGLVYFGVGPAMAIHGYWQGSKAARIAKATRGAAAAAPVS